MRHKKINIVLATTLFSKAAQMNFYKLEETRIEVTISGLTLFHGISKVFFCAQVAIKFIQSNIINYIFNSINILSIKSIHSNFNLL